MTRGCTTLLGLAITAVALTACGGDDDGGDDGTTDTTAPAAAAATIAPGVTLPEGVTIPSIPADALDYANVMQNLTPDQLACIGGQADAMASGNPDTMRAAFEECGVNVDELANG